jgi:hypothetical protein
MNSYRICINVLKSPSQYPEEQTARNSNQMWIVGVPELDMKFYGLI